MYYFLVYILKYIYIQNNSKHFVVYIYINCWRFIYTILVYIYKLLAFIDRWIVRRMEFDRRVAAGVRSKEMAGGGRRWWRWPLRRRWRSNDGAGDERRRWRRTGDARQGGGGALCSTKTTTKELPDPGQLLAYIGVDPLAPDRGWNRC